MTTTTTRRRHSRSLSRPRSRDAAPRRALHAFALAAPVYVGAAAVPEGGLLRGRLYRDVGLYGDYAAALLDGRLPYRDFFVEYPPGGFLVFTPPALLPDDWYPHAFKTLMALLGLATLLLVALVLAQLGASGRRLYAAVFALALAPLALGPVSLNTYDAWPALLVVAALAALVRERPVPALALLGVAFASKLYAAALVPLFAAWLWRRRQNLLRPLGAFAAAALVVVGPFAVLGWDGFVESVDAQAGRGLQVESLGAALLLAAHRLGLYDAAVVRGSTAAVSRDLAGALPDALAAATTLLQLAAVATVVVLFLRARPDAERLVAATAATIAGFVVFSRFISPQYLIWAVPLVPLVAGGIGVGATALLGAALVAAQLWFFHYRDVFELGATVWLVVLRDALLVALYGVLVLALLRTKIPSSANTVRQEPLRTRRASGSAVVEGAERRSR